MTKVGVPLIQVLDRASILDEDIGARRWIVSRYQPGRNVNTLHVEVGKGIVRTW